MEIKNGTLSVFLSHSHKDVDKVRKIRDILETISCDPIMFYLKCLDDDNVVLEDFIKKEIEARNIFIYCKSSHAEKSIWVQKELDYIRQLDKKRLYEIDIEENFEFSLTNTLSVLVKLVNRNNIILWHSNMKEDKKMTNKISSQLHKYGYSVHYFTIPFLDGLPSMNNLVSWDYQKYKQYLDLHIEKQLLQQIIQYSSKGVLVPLLSPNMFVCDTNWVNCIYSKIEALCKTQDYLTVPINLAEYKDNKRGINEIVDVIYKKTISF